jgi:hypothetical protein
LKRLHGFHYAVFLDVPTMTFGTEPDGWDDDRRRQKLEYQSHTPIPITKTLAIL